TRFVGKIGMSNWRLGQYFLLWSGCVGLGLWALFNYALTAPFPADAAPSWPAATSLSRDKSHPTLLMFLHPNCPCSRASVAGLSRLLAQAGDRLAVRVVFVRPEGLQPAAEEQTLAQLAAEIPDALVVWDEAGVEAERFGAATSGETLLYSAA